MSFAIGDLISGGGSPDYGTQAAQAEQRRQVAINQGTAKINQAYQGFTPSFYRQREQAYTDAAMPQLGQQYKQTRDATGFNLANRGLIGSGAAEKGWSDLATAMTNAKNNVADQARQQSQNLETQVEGMKDQQLNYLYQSADPAGAGAQATATAASFSTPSAIPALANQFSALLNQYYTSQLINSYKPVSYIQAPQATGDQGGYTPFISQGGNQ